MTQDILALWPYAVGYVFATVVAHRYISGVAEQIWCTVHTRSSEGRPVNAALRSGAVGVVERALYVIALQMGKPGFIALWFTIKTAAQHRDWSEGVRDEGGKVVIPGRALFKNFLIGNGLSLLYAVAAARITVLLAGKQYPLALLVVLGLLVGTFVLESWIEMKRRTVPPQSPAPKPK